MGLIVTLKQRAVGGEDADNVEEVVVKILAVVARHLCHSRHQRLVGSGLDGGKGIGISHGLNPIVALKALAVGTKTVVGAVDIAEDGVID